MKYLSILILPFILFASSIEAEKVIDAGGCQTKLIQKMEPQYPNTNHTFKRLIVSLSISGTILCQMKKAF